MINLNHKIALVTGSTKGIGKEIAVTLAGLGATVVINSHDSKEEGTGLAASLVSTGKKAIYICADAADPSSVNAMVREIVNTCGRIDILINNVGRSQTKPMMALSEESFEEALQYNLMSAYYCIHGVIKQMIMQRSGRIINISSTAGTNGMPFETHYSAAKSGLIGLSKALAKEMGAKGITCNVVAPGVIDTGTHMGEQGKAERTEDVLDLIPVKRKGTPLDVAGIVAFLASDYASYITGEVIKVDGGLFI